MTGTRSGKNKKLILITRHSLLHILIYNQFTFKMTLQLPPPPLPPKKEWNSFFYNKQLQNCKSTSVLCTCSDKIVSPSNLKVNKMRENSILLHSLLSLQSIFDAKQVTQSTNDNVRFVPIKLLQNNP